MRVHGFVIPLFLALAASTGHALPPGASRDLHDGANHRIGDAGFVAAHGRAPGPRDPEREQMRAHLAHVRAVLGSRPATRPELAARRAELLGYLDDYIAKGITPVNTRLPWRSPVFIDDAGTICAVGYLIERSAGRALAETIAARHRYDYLEDIVAAMPEVRAWIAASGLSLDELASIQPGYSEPEVESWVPWNLAKAKVGDGPLAFRGARGVVRRHHMHGAWTQRAGERVVGEGRLRAGAGLWTSYHEDGSRMATGPMVNDVPHGVWTLFHPSGHVAARGRFTRGHRDGAWTFFHDTAARTPIARGRFSMGRVGGTWRHYDAAGELLATSRPARPRDDMGDATLMTIVPGADGVRHQVHRFGGVDSSSLHGLYQGDERLYVERDRIYDAGGHALSRVGETWHAADCGWSAKRKRIARAAELATLHRLLANDGREATCDAARPVAAARAARLDAILRARAAIRAPTPAFVKQLALRGAVAEDDLADMTRVLAATMQWYVEWPHVDGRFIQLFATLPGYRPFGPGEERTDALVEPSGEVNQ